MNTNKTMLSKTDFLLFLESPMHLWASAHQQLEPKPITPYQQHLAQQGQMIEALAHTYLEENLLPNYSNAQIIWQPTYDDGKFMIRADALIFDRQTQSYDLYEIKSATSTRKEHLLDLTFQVLLLETILNLRNVYILHINKSYQHSGELVLDKFFSVEEQTTSVEKHREKVAMLREEAWAVTQMDRPDPSFACTKPQTCPCPDLCHPQLPENPVYNLPYIGIKAIQLREMGITAIEDIPPTFNLSEVQQKHFQAVRTGQPLINTQEIKLWLGNLQYPLYFLDYETFNPALPLFTGYQPYEHITFQYSLHVIDRPGDEPQHFEFLSTDRQDPALRVTAHLLKHVGTHGSVLVWNQSFEAQRNKDLAKHCPEYQAQLMGINQRLTDLMRVFKDGHYVHPDFHGSASLKAVLPILCPDLSYEGLPISNGEDAMLTWYRLQTSEIPAGERAEIEKSMKTYCGLDTFGMVAILEKLEEVTRSNDGS